MIGVLLAAVINLGDVAAARKTIDRYCRVLGCSKPVLISILPEEKMRGVGARTRWNDKGCSIQLKPESLKRVDWLAHEACHCARPRASEDDTITCQQALLELCSGLCAKGLK